MTPAFCPEGIPAAIAELHNFFVDKAKVPHSVKTGKRRTGTQGSPADIASMVSFEDAMTALATGKWDGAGIGLTKSTRLGCVDLDKCIDPATGKPSQFAASVLAAIGPSYTEISRSGTGLHIFVLVPMEGVTTFKTKGVEFYFGKQYIALTGNRLPGTPAEVNPISDAALQRLHDYVDRKKAAKENAGNQADNSQPANASKSGDKTRDHARRYCLGALDKAIDRVRGAVEGERNNELNKAVRGVARLIDTGGIDEATVRAAFTTAAESIGLPYGEIKATLDSAIRSGRADPRAIPPPKQQQQKKRQSGDGADSDSISEDKLALEFESEWEALLAHAHKFGHWYIRDQQTGIWDRDLVDNVFHLIRESNRTLNTSGAAKWLKASVVSSVERLVRVSPSFALTGDEFDGDDWLLGTPDGVVDLKTGASVVPAADQYVSKRTSVSPKSGPPKLWLKFLKEASKDDQPRVDYLQRLCGYCLTGDTSEEALVFVHGPGGNGKGVFMNTVRDIMGEYAKQAPMQVFLANTGDRHPTEVANLFGARLVLGSESSEGKRWDEERIKSFTGRDAIAARFMNRDFFEFVPKFKIIVASNHKPRIRTVDDAWRRRLHLVPFVEKPEKADPQLKDKLKAEYPQILQWMIEGAEWWGREGLCPPESVTAATEEYFREEDVIGLWFEECCEAKPFSESIERKSLYQSFENWCHGMGHAAANMHTVTRWLKQQGYAQATNKASRPILGVGFKELDGSQ